jgi:hypothetical protein
METSGSAAAARRRRGLRLGVAGAVLAFLTLTTVQAVGVNPYLPPDELYHVGYALVVRDGRLPELTTKVPQDEVPLRVPDHGDRRIYTANHPPLYYLPVSLALRIGSPAAAFLAARLVSVAFGAAGVLLVAWLALALLPSRPRVAIGAAWFAALLPAVPQYSAFVYNDALGFMASTGAMVAAVLALRRGPSFWRLAALTLAAAAAALTRAPRDRPGRSRRARGGRRLVAAQRSHRAGKGGAVTWRRRAGRRHRAGQLGLVLPAEPRAVRRPHRGALQRGAEPHASPARRHQPGGLAAVPAGAVRRPVGLDALRADPDPGAACARAGAQGAGVGGAGRAAGRAGPHAAGAALAGAGDHRGPLAAGGRLAAGRVPHGRLVRRQRRAHARALPAAGDRGRGGARRPRAGRAARCPARPGDPGDQRGAAGPDPRGLGALH